MSERKLRIKASKTPADGLATDAIIHWGASIQANKLLKFRDWTRQGQPTPRYTAFAPSYIFAPKWEEKEDKVTIVNMAMERCFGCRSDPNWAIWIQGDELQNVLAQFREEYVKIEKEKGEELLLLDLWAEKILEELKRIFNNAATQEPPIVLGRLVVPGASNTTPLRRSSRSPSRVHASVTDSVESSVSSQVSLATGSESRPLSAISNNTNDGESSDNSSSDDNDDEEADVLTALAKSSKKVSNEKKRTITISDDSDEADTATPTSAKAPANKKRKRVPATGSTLTARAKGKSRSVGRPRRTVQPHTPSGMSAVSAGDSAPPTPTPTMGDSKDSDEVLTPSGSLKPNIRDYFHAPKINHRGSYDYACRYCPTIAPNPLKGTPNLHYHQRRCRYILEAIKRKVKGVACTREQVIGADEPRQTSLDSNSLSVIPPFSKEEFWKKLAIWVASDALPFRTVESPALRDAFRFCHPEAVLCSADTVASRIADEYTVMKNVVGEYLGSLNTTIHFSHDAWTDSHQSNGFLGVCASFVDENFQYREMLIALIHLDCKHDADAFANKLFTIFEALGITKRLGPGTADNASVNSATADVLNERIFGQHLIDFPAKNLVGCVCHIANLAAKSFLRHETLLEAEDYVDKPPELPSISVCPAEEEDKEWRDEEDEESLEEADFDEAEEGDSSNLSPLYLVKRLAHYVLLSEQRKKVFLAIKAAENPEVKASLPLKHVETRWNSIQLAIQRVIKLKNTVLAFCQRYKNDEKCPPFSTSSFDILMMIEPVLGVFQELTAIYSEKTVTVHRILPDLHHALESLRHIQETATMSDARCQPIQQARDKLRKYITRFINNDWVCAAYCLDPENRTESLKNLLAAYDMPERLEEVDEWIHDRVKKYEPTDVDLDIAPVPEKVVRGRQPARHNAFASRKTATAIKDGQDAWKLYNIDNSPFGEPSANETLLEYWARHDKTWQMRPLARVARDVLGLAGSSASVERLFSQSGLVTSNRRARLLPERVIHQTSLKVWGREGFRAMTKMQKEKDDM